MQRSLKKSAGFWGGYRRINRPCVIDRYHSITSRYTRRASDRYTRIRALETVIFVSPTVTLALGTITFVSLTVSPDFHASCY